MIRNLYCIMYEEEDIEASSLRLQHSIRYDTIRKRIGPSMVNRLTVHIPRADATLRYSNYNFYAVFDCLLLFDTLFIILLYGIII